SESGSRSSVTSSSAATMPQPMSTPTAAGITAFLVGMTEPTVAPMPTWASGMRATWPTTMGNRAVFSAWRMVSGSTSLAQEISLSLSLVGTPPASPLGVRGRAPELDTDGGLVADDPSVVAGRDQVRAAGLDVDLRAVVVLDVHRAGDQIAKVLGLAAVGLGDGLDALRPLPSRLEREPADLGAADVYDLDAGLVGRADLIRRVHVLAVDAGHGPSPLVGGRVYSDVPRDP